MHLDFVSVELDFVSDLEFPWRLAIPGHLFLALLKCCFGVGSCFLELIEMLVNCRDVTTTTGGDGEVELIAVHDFKWGVLQGRLDAAVDREFSYWEKHSSIILSQIFPIIC